MLFRNASEIQNDRVIIFSLGGPAPSGRRRAIRFTALRSVLAPIPAAAGTRNCIGIFQAATEVRASVPAGGGLTVLPADVFLRPFRARVEVPPLTMFAAEW